MSTQTADQYDGSREEYEQAAHTAGLEPMTDDAITGYAMTYGDPNRLTDVLACQQALSRSRRARLVAERAASRRARLDEYEARYGPRYLDGPRYGGGCSDCGCSDCSDCG